MFHTVEFMQIKPLVSYGSIESFHISILRRLAWLYVEERDMVFGRLLLGRIKLSQTHFASMAQLTRGPQ